MNEDDPSSQRAMFRMESRQITMTEPLFVGVLGHRHSGQSTACNTLFGTTVRTGQNARPVTLYGGVCGDVFQRVARRTRPVCRRYQKRKLTFDRRGITQPTTQGRARQSRNVIVNKLKRDRADRRRARDKMSRVSLSGFEVCGVVHHGLNRVWPWRRAGFPTVPQGQIIHRPFPRAKYPALRTVRQL